MSALKIRLVVASTRLTWGLSGPSSPRATRITSPDSARDWRSAWRLVKMASSMRVARCWTGRTSSASRTHVPYTRNTVRAAPSPGTPGPPGPG